MKTAAHALASDTAMQMLPPPMAVALAANFGSVDRWVRECMAIVGSLTGDSGEVRLTFLPHTGSLVHQRMADDSHVPAGAIPILAMDVSECACTFDEGPYLADPIATFMDRIPWGAVHQRYQQAVHDAAAAYGATHNEIGGALLLDVRRAGVFEAAEDFMEGAQWRDPARVKNWASEFLPDQDIVVYCVAGHEISRGTALQLRALGLHARFLLGGIEAWKASGKPTTPKSVGSL